VAVDIKVISINTDSNGFDNLFDYADMLQELADEVAAFRNTHRDGLNVQERDQLRSFASQIRAGAVTLAVAVSIQKINELQPDLDKIRSETSKLDNFLTNIANVKAIISGLARTINLLGNILSLLP
jgi:methyl-accepting chemotaxis protein